ncbi:hypothetical protein FRZ67_22295 [Panacibacter ginsenosidivorans]|uniref:Tetratricopeptide repeat protein n=1 Tax=Panacibacter ginsenosidivorans TaxID=1813871 RepID=A0A5B8VEI5_9BACT|nr:hypothetical protein [Panacibacter ginsenosidivorans]QEC69894.1 hypothetical protein FRZ67_22295 [Panacibacter ginsenosidivorans]
MNEAGKNIIQQLFGQTDLSNITRRDIEAIASKYPYFGPAQFLLAKKLKDSNGNGVEEQLQKASLYFNNPYWLNYLLIEETLQENTTDADTETFITEEYEPVQEQEPDALIEETTAAHVEMENELPETIEDTSSETINEPATINEHIEETKEVFQSTEENISVAPSDVPSEITEISTQSVEHNIEIEETNQPEVNEDDLPIDDYENEIADDTQKLKLSSLIEQHLSEFKKPVTENDQLPIKSSPYHTIDYFASQGIRADGQDKLSSRVRKFTDWLKQMKGANVQPTDLGTDAETEQMIETIAQTSNETKDIVTEAMAEVLTKQGKTEKAIQLYKKLSFLNPAKSTYFAAKIEDLNSK